MEPVTFCFMAQHFAQEDHEKLVVVGADSALGEWDVSRGLAMANLPKGSAQWVGVAHVAPGTTHYKLVRTSPTRGACWEDSIDNRELRLPGGTQQALVKCSFDRQPQTLELTQEPVAPLPSLAQGKAQLLMPYWRHGLDATFRFVQKIGGNQVTRECVYDPAEGAAVVTVDVPEDSTIAGFFLVLSQHGQEISDERTLSLPSGKTPFRVTWPYSNTESHSLTDVTHRGPNKTEDADEAHTVPIKCLQVASGDLTEDLEKTPTETISPCPEISEDAADAQTVSYHGDHQMSPDKPPKELKKKKTGVRGLVKRIRRLFCRRRK